MEIEEEEDIIIWLFCRLCYLKAFNCPIKLLKHEAEHRHKISSIRKKRHEKLKDNNVVTDVVVVEKTVSLTPVIPKQDASPTPTNKSSSSLSLSPVVATEEIKMGKDSPSSKCVALFQQDNDATDESSSGSRIVYDLVPDSPISKVPELPCTSEDVIILEANKDDGSQHSRTDKKSSFVTIDLTSETNSTVQINDINRSSEHTGNNDDDGLVEIIDTVRSRNHRPKRTASKSNTIEIDLTLHEEDSRKNSDKTDPSVDNIEVDGWQNNKESPEYEKIEQNKVGPSLLKPHHLSQRATARKRVRCPNFTINHRRTPTSPPNSDNETEVSDDNQTYDESGKRVCKRGRPPKRPAICMCHHCGLTYRSVKSLEDHVRQKHYNL